jgi:hypothetical protein
MKKILLFEGKTTMGGRDVDIKIYRVEDNNSKYYEWDYNPYLVDESQMDVHLGEIKIGKDLEEIMFRINSYKNEIRKIKDVKENPNF